MSRFITILIVVFSLTSCTTGMSRKKVDAAVDSAGKDYHAAARWQEREVAIKTVTAFVTAEAVALKLEALEDTHSRVRVAAANGLSAAISNAEIREKLAEKARRDREASVRYSALKTLVPSDAPELYPLFIFYANSRDWLFREIAFKGLIAINDTDIVEKSVPTIVKGLRDENESVKVAILESIEVKKSEYYEEIRKIFFTEGYETQITLLCATLKALSGYNLDIRVRERVERLILHPNKRVRILALRVLKSEPDYMEKRSN
ncbi:MAG: hypothetical protein PF637_02240 [Spirochaetes bacterium]|jgi:hypothetical protein|nr:hypothetical protein [Spirochaetota bacterium]